MRHHLDSSSIPSQWNCDWEKYQTSYYLQLNQRQAYKKTKEMITNLKELLIFNYILLVSCMSEMYQEQYGENTYWWKCVNSSLFFSLS